MVQVVQQLTAQLLSALNDEGKVTDETIVDDVIAKLEKMPVTPEMLETTRVGKHVNDIRKRLKSERLAKRAKKLIKKWHKFVSFRGGGGSTNPSTPTSRSSTPNGFVVRKLAAAVASVSYRAPSSVAPSSVAPSSVAPSDSDDARPEQEEMLEDEEDKDKDKDERLSEGKDVGASVPVTTTSAGCDDESRQRPDVCSDEKCRPSFVVDESLRETPLYGRQWDGVDGRVCEDVFFEWREPMPFLNGSPSDGGEGESSVVQPYVYLQ